MHFAILINSFRNVVSWGEIVYLLILCLQFPLQDLKWTSRVLSYSV